MRTYQQMAKYYDELYSWKDYKHESEKLHKIIQRHKRTDGNELLDVACGTGRHLQYLRKRYHVTGVDLNEGMLRVARKNNPGVRFAKGNMLSLKLGKKFDVVTCLFSSIAYVKTYPALRKAIRSLAGHVKDGGVLVIEPFFPPKVFKERIHALHLERPDLNVTRLCVSKRRGNVGILDMHYLIADWKGVQHVHDRQEVGLYEPARFLSLLRKAGFSAKFLKQGLMPERGLFVGVKLPRR